MSAPIRHVEHRAAHERELGLLSRRTGASPAEPRALSVPEFARLEMGAKVGSYLGVLTESNVRGMLRRKLAAGAHYVHGAVVRP